MITSDKQYKASKKQLAMLMKSSKAPAKKAVPEIIANAGKAQLQELISKVEEQMQEFDALKNSELADLKIHSLEDLVLSPIRYRLAAHMSIESFGRKVGVSARQIARYESEKYSNINIKTFRQILKGIDIILDGNFAP